MQCFGDFTNMAHFLTFFLRERVTVYLEQSEDKIKESVHPFHYACFQESNSDVRLGSKCVYSLRHFASLDKTFLRPAMNNSTLPKRHLRIGYHMLLCQWNSCYNKANVNFLCKIEKVFV